MPSATEKINMKNSYQKILTPIYQVRRWFRIVFKGRVGKAVKTIKANATVSDDSRKKTAELFENLGL